MLVQQQREQIMRRYRLRGFALDSVCHRCFAYRPFRTPQQSAYLKRYAGQPKTDVALVMLFEVGFGVFGAFASAWVGYGLRLLLAFYLKR
jgi:hypothetical protein